MYCRKDKDPVGGSMNSHLALSSDLLDELGHSPQPL